MFTFKFESMGTELEIQIFDDVSKILEEKVKSEIFDFTVFYDESFSRFKENSLITKISKSTGIFEVPKDLIDILNIYKIFFNITDGAMSPLIGNTLSDLGYDANYTLMKKENISKTPNFLEVVKIFGENSYHKKNTINTIEVSEKVLIDIGAIGKGFWVDQVKNILEKNKITHFLINGSGDIYYSSPNNSKVKINLENSLGNIFATTEIVNEAICGSGTLKRNWSIKKADNLHHIINARTSLPTENLESVWVKVKSEKFPTTYADGLATAIFFVEPSKLQEIVKKDLEINFEYYIIYTNKKILFSKNFFS